MTAAPFTLDDLKRVLLEGSGAPEGVDLDAADVPDTEFEQLGYDSLALLETASRIEREYGIELDESVVGDATTPRAFVAAVAAHAA
ncbi:acyl carrier protein [Streptomyces spectabilis]|uniref:Acyl carrier protein n=1 Tax=Streptomyces spectabilis TaxID=68270 RepID=A0A5P2X6D5_STRST|nr:acyl carrier protein [Streptomyces spectabilis]MBB5106819.1 act minimal PKS acyl carrier protein [Streptomyces spectabilis]MCI3903330.1 acyl carrier protein [Streptomyces spectabilis]QEV60553.1 acyl carrier protein [Streptomyces spectabilis]GGV44036.1 actinorhodin polyketide synthase acyl carrier protein [Streptomyces spectabilis]